MAKMDIEKDLKKKVKIRKPYTIREYKKMKREGVSLYCPKKVKTQPAIKGYKISFTNRLGYKDEKFVWICVDCGLIWFSREQAINCRERGHISFYILHNHFEEKALGRVNLNQFFDYSKVERPEIYGYKDFPDTPDILTEEEEKLKQGVKEIFEASEKVKVSSLCDLCLEYLNTETCPHSRGLQFSSWVCQIREFYFYSQLTAKKTFGILRRKKKELIAGVGKRIE